MTDIETTQNFEEALKLLHIDRAEPTSYVYYDSGTGTIVCISNQEMSEFSGKSLCMMPTTQVMDFLEGTKSTAEYVIVQDEKDILKHHLVKREIELTPLRSVSKLLVEIEEGENAFAPIHIERYAKDNKVRVFLSDDVRQGLAKINATFVTIHGYIELAFYFTAKDDPSFLVEQVTVPAKDLVNRSDLWLDMKTDLEGTSLYTKKVFPAYEYKVLR